MITKVELKNFTVFENIILDFSSGINIFIGENGTGKTHLMKVIYAACTTIDSKQQKTFPQKLCNVFYPDNKNIGRLIHRAVGRNSCSISIERNDVDTSSIQLNITSLMKKSSEASIIMSKNWQEDVRYQAIYIPVKDMMANAPGFVALYENNHIYFEEIYVDILNKVYLPTLKGPCDNDRKQLLTTLSKAISGKVVEKNGIFYLNGKSSGGNLEFTLLAEGYRKLGLLWSLIQNGVLTKGSLLFWDEPEANLNPKLAKTVAEILLKLQKMGVQIFIATHDYVFLKELDFATTAKDKVKYFSLYKENGSIKHSETEHFENIENNPIADAFNDLLNREIQRSLEVNNGN